MATEQEAQREDPARVLIVEDDRTVAEVVERYLRREGFDVVSVGDGEVALRQAEQTPFDLVVLDIMLPTVDGLEVCRRLRHLGSVPIIMLTALGEETDRIAGLELGADDYICKPFSPRELTARVKSVLRRTRPTSGDMPAGLLRAGELSLDLEAREAVLAEQRLQLTVREFDLLAYLMSHPRRVFTREDLLERVWGYTFGDKSTVTVHVRRLREKVESDPSVPRHIVTVWGVGYRFDP